MTGPPADPPNSLRINRGSGNASRKPYRRQTAVAQYIARHGHPTRGSRYHFLRGHRRPFGLEVVIDTIESESRAGGFPVRVTGDQVQVVDPGHESADTPLLPQGNIVRFRADVGDSVEITLAGAPGPGNCAKNGPSGHGHTFILCVFVGPRMGQMTYMAERNRKASRTFLIDVDDSAAPR